MVVCTFGLREENERLVYRRDSGVRVARQRLQVSVSTQRVYVVQRDP